MMSIGLVDMVDQAQTVQWTLCMLVAIDTTDGKVDGLYCGLTCQQQRAGGD
jgi:hypothetical protein